MQIIQNIACLQVTANSNDSKIKLFRDILRDKKINAIYFYASFDQQIYSPINSDVALSLLSFIENNNFYLNAIDANNKHFIRDFNLINSTEYNRGHIMHPLELNRVLDMDNVFLNYKSAIEGSGTFLIYFLYQTKSFTPTLPEINSSISVTIPVTADVQDISLYSILGNRISDLPLRGIHINNQFAPEGFLELKSKDGRRHIENVPLSYLKPYEPKSFTIDPLLVDAEKSYVRIRMQDALDYADHFINLTLYF